MMLATALAATPWLTADEAFNEPAETIGQKSLLRREGTQLRDEPGRFLASGNRLTFISTKGTNYIGLENLNLERIGKIVATSPDAVEWFVTGVVTEYQGANYLLISRVRRKASLSAGRRTF